MRLTRAELTRLLGHSRRKNLRPFPTLDRPTDAPRESDPTMAPTRGLTPAISGLGWKLYVYFARERVAFARWSDGRARVPVTWLTFEAYQQARSARP